MHGARGKGLLLPWVAGIVAVPGTAAIDSTHPSLRGPLPGKACAAAASFGRLEFVANATVHGPQVRRLPTHVSFVNISTETCSKRCLDCRYCTAFHLVQSACILVVVLLDRLVCGSIANASAFTDVGPLDLSSHRCWLVRNPRSFCAAADDSPVAVRPVQRVKRGPAPLPPCTHCRAEALKISPLAELLDPSAPRNGWVPSASIRRVAFAVWGQARALILPHAVERLIHLSLDRTARKGITIDVFVWLPLPRNGSLDCEFIDCSAPGAYWQKRFAAAVSRHKNVHLRAVVVEDESSLFEEVVPTFYKNMYDFLDPGDRSGCAESGPAMQTRRVGDIEGIRCRAVINIFIWYAMKRLWAEIAHVEQVEDFHYDVIHHTRTDVIRLLPMPSLADRFREYEIKLCTQKIADCTSRVCFLENGDHHGLFYRGIGSRIMRALDLFATRAGLERLVHSFDEDHSLTGAIRCSDNIAFHFGRLLGVFVLRGYPYGWADGYENFYSFSYAIGRVRRGGGLELAACLGGLPVELYELCQLLCPTCETWKWTGRWPASTDWWLMESVKSLSQRDPPATPALASRFLSMYTDADLSFMLERPVDFESWWESEELCGDSQYDQLPCREVFPRCQANRKAIASWLRAQDMVADKDGVRVPKPWRVPRGICRFRPAGPCLTYFSGRVRFPTPKATLWCRLRSSWEYRRVQPDSSLPT